LPRNLCSPLKLFLFPFNAADSLLFGAYEQARHISDPSVSRIAHRQLPWGSSSPPGCWRGHSPLVCDLLLLHGFFLSSLSQPVTHRFSICGHLVQTPFPPPQLWSLIRVSALRAERHRFPWLYSGLRWTLRRLARVTAGLPRLKKHHQASLFLLEMIQFLLGLQSGRMGSGIKMGKLPCLFQRLPYVVTSGPEPPSIQKGSSQPLFSLFHKKPWPLYLFPKFLLLRAIFGSTVDLFLPPDADVQIVSPFSCIFTLFPRFSFSSKASARHTVPHADDIPPILLFLF